MNALEKYIHDSQEARKQYYLESASESARYVYFEVRMAVSTFIALGLLVVLAAGGFMYTIISGEEPRILAGVAFFIVAILIFYWAFLVFKYFKGV